MKISAIKDNTLSEALAQPYPYKWTKKSDRKYEAVYGKLMIAFIHSTFRGRNNWEIAFDVDGREDMTGEGDAFKILSTVVAATREWWAEQDATKIKTIEFVADKDTDDGNGRTALYRRFAKQFANNIGFVARDGTDRTSKFRTNYVLTNPNFQSSVNEVEIDNRNGRGAVPDNQDIDHFGMRVKMRPSTFIKLAAPLERDQAKQEMIDYVKSGGAIGAPFLIVRIDDDGVEVTGHEGRNRMLAVYAAEGDSPIETHLFFRGRVKRARHLTPEIIQKIKAGMSQENTGKTVTGPLWEDGKIVKGVNTTADVQPGETQRQAAKFGNKLNSKGEPPLLNAKARKNTSPHVLGNLGLAEAAQDVTAFGVDATTSETDDMIVLDQVKARDRGTGAGTKYMQELTQYADSVDKPIMLTPSNSLGGSVARLKKFYKRFDFVERNGRTKSYEMIRYPQTKKVTEAIKLPKTKKVNLPTLVNKLKRTYQLQDLTLSDWSERNAIEISSIIIGKENQKAGIGSAVMADIVNFADAKGRILALDPALKDKNHGTTSQTRLRKFYKRFGFVDNKGRNKNFEFRSLMLRYPHSKKVTEAHQLNELFDKQYNWHWKIEPDAMDATSRADFRTHDDQLVAVGFDLQSGNASVDFAKNFAFDATNEGDQFRIFATVMDVIRDYVGEIDPKTLTFSAEKDPKTNSMSRIKLYKRMVAKFAQQINMNFEFHDGSAATIFKLTNNNMNEAIKKPRPEDTLGVSRADMPQIHASHYPELFNYLKQNGATISKGAVQATELKAVQREFSDAGIEKMMRKGGVTADGTKKPLIVSADNYIIDGHHRWLAAYNLEEEVPIIKFSLPVKELLQLVKDFKHTTYRGIYKEKKDVNENISVTGTERHKQEREKNLEPGTEAWFAHWFSLPKMTREDLNYFKEEVVKFVNDKKGVQDEKTINDRGHNRH
jgi:hypothetical protein